MPLGFKGAAVLTLLALNGVTSQQQVQAELNPVAPPVQNQRPLGNNPVEEGFELVAEAAVDVTEGTIASAFNTYRHPKQTAQKLKGKLFDADGGYTPEAQAERAANAGKNTGPNSIAGAAAVVVGEIAEGTAKSWLATWTDPITTFKNLGYKLFGQDGGYTPEALAAMKEKDNKPVPKEWRTEF